MRRFGCPCLHSSCKSMEIGLKSCDQRLTPISDPQRYRENFQHITLQKYIDSGCYLSCASICNSTSKQVFELDTHLRRRMSELRLWNPPKCKRTKWEKQKECLQIWTWFIGIRRGWGFFLNRDAKERVPFILKDYSLGSNQHDVLHH